MSIPTTETPPTLRLIKLKDNFSVTVVGNEVNESHPLFSYRQSFCKPRFGSVELRDGTRLYYNLILPKAMPEKAPLVVYTYGGPKNNIVKDAWFTDERPFWCQVLAASGIAVLLVDNRGSDNRGLAFESVLHNHMGQTEVDDQIEACRKIIASENIDGQRIGIYGWSYGGYMVLRSMLRYPDFFKVGVAVAPVSDWRLYDTHYTERYLGKPQNNASAYEASSCLPLAGSLKGKLLLVHGMADDNVFYTNSTKIYAQFQKKGNPLT